LRSWPGLIRLTPSQEQEREDDAEALHGGLAVETTATTANSVPDHITCLSTVGLAAHRALGSEEILEQLRAFLG
jgi:hypothetical protein